MRQLCLSVVTLVLPTGVASRPVCAQPPLTARDRCLVAVGRGRQVSPATGAAATPIPAIGHAGGGHPAAPGARARGEPRDGPQSVSGESPRGDG
jgi:hypothetical protein